MTHPLAALAFALLAPVQDEVDAALRDLAGRLSKEGLSAKLAEALATDAGMQAVRERIDVLTSARTARVERDPQGAYETFLFAEDLRGDHALRPERRAEVDDLRRRAARAERSMDSFFRRCDAMAKRIAETSPLEQKARAAWSDREFRIAFFHRHPAELRELDLEELASAALLRGLVRGPDGKRSVGGAYGQELRDRIQGTYDQLEGVKPYEKAYLKEAVRIADGAARATLGSDAGSLVVLGRLLRQSTEGSQEQIGGITEGDAEKGLEPVVSFNLELQELAPAVREVEAVSAALKTMGETLAGELATGGPDEPALLEFLRHDRARLLLAERIEALRRDQGRKAEEIVDAVLNDGFEPDGDALRVKKGRYPGDEGKDSPDALQAELDGVIEEFNGTARWDLDRIAERCADAATAALFEDRTATFLLLEHRDTVVERLTDALRRRGADYFIQGHLSKEGDAWTVRSDRARRVEEVLRRAEEIRKEAEAVEKEQEK